MSIAGGCHPPPFLFSMFILLDVIRRLSFLYVHYRWMSSTAFLFSMFILLDVIRRLLYVHYRWMSSTALLFLHSQICIYQKFVVPLHRQMDNLGPPTGANVVHPVGRAETPNAQMTTLSSVNARGRRKRRTFASSNGTPRLRLLRPDNIWTVGSAAFLFTNHPERPSAFGMEKPIDFWLRKSER